MTEQQIKQANEIINLAKQLNDKINKICEDKNTLCKDCPLTNIENCGKYSDIADLEEIK